MIRTLINKGLDAFERALHLPGSMDYLRHIARVSLPAFAKFSLFMPLASHRRVLPPAPYYAARIVASQHADCGPCVQLEVNQARQHDVPADTVQAVLDDAPDRLSPDLADVHRFAQTVVTHDPAVVERRERVRDHFGEEGLVELSLAIAAAQVFPVTKRGLGYAKSCALVDVHADGTAPASS